MIDYAEPNAGQKYPKKNFRIAIADVGNNADVAAKVVAKLNGSQVEIIAIDEIKEERLLKGIDMAQKRKAMFAEPLIEPHIENEPSNKPFYYNVPQRRKNRRRY